MSKFFYLNKQHFSGFYIERNKNNYQGLRNMADARYVSSPNCQF